MRGVHLLFPMKSFRIFRPEQQTHYESWYFAWPKQVDESAMNPFPMVTLAW